MNPLLLSALLSAAPGLLSSLFGDPRQKLLKKQNQIIGSQGGLTNQLYQQFLGSPAYSQGQASIAAGANQAQGQLAGSLGARGISGSGTGDILGSLGSSLVGNQMAGLKTAGYQGAQQQAQTQIQQQLAALQGTAGPGRTEGLFGAGINAFGPLLQAWLQHKYPQFAPTGAVGAPRVGG